MPRSSSCTATLGSQTFGILSSPFLDAAFHTLSFRIRVTINGDGTWSYEEDTVLQLPDRDDVFHHIDRNTLTRVAPSAPNPLVALLPVGRAAGSLGIGDLRNERETCKESLDATVSQS